MAGTINIANIAILFDPTSVKNGVAVTRTEMATLRKTLEASLTPMEKLRREMDVLAMAFSSGKLGTGDEALQRKAKMAEVISEKYGLITVKQRKMQEEQDRIAAAEKKAEESAKEYAKHQKEIAAAKEKIAKDARSQAESEAKIAANSRSAAIAKAQQNAKSPDDLERDKLKALMQQDSVLRSINATEQQRKQAYETLAKQIGYITSEAKKQEEIEKQKTKELQLQEHMQKLRANSIKLEHEINKQVVEERKRKEQELAEFMQKLRANSIRLEHEINKQQYEQRKAQEQKLRDERVAHEKHVAGIKDKLAKESREKAKADAQAADMNRASALQMALRNAQTPPERLKEQKRLLMEQDALLRSIGASEEKRKIAYEVLAGQLGYVTKQMREQDSLSRSSGMSIGRLTAGGLVAMGGYKVLSMFTQGLEAITLGSIRLRAELEMSETAFKLLTGSVQEAETILKEMRRLDKESPLDFMAIQRAGKTFIGYGLEVKKLMPMLTSLSKVSLGNQERFELLSLAMAQVASRGKLAGDEVRQMVNQGFNPLLAIAESLSKELGGKPVQYMDRLRKDMEAGLISFDMVYSALQNLTNGTGRFAEVNKESLDNVQGKWNKLLSTINETRLAIGKAIEPATKAVLDQALANPAKQKVTPGGVMIGNMGPEARKAYEEEVIKQEKWRKGMERAAQAQKEMQEKANQTSVAKQQEEAKKKKEAEDKKQEQKELRERLEKETEKINVDIAGQARRLGMTPKQAVLDEKFFDLIEKVGSAFSANSIEVKKLNDLMAKAGKQFDEELKVKQKEMQDKANEKTKNLQNKFNEWLRKSSNPDGITSNKTEMLQRDSVEAYKFLIKQQDTLEKRREEIAERQKDLTEEIRDINKKMQEEMKDAPRLVKI